MEVGQQATPQSASTAVIEESNFPALYRAADQNSLDRSLP
jgi:hypothetical protein